MLSRRKLLVTSIQGALLCTSGAVLTACFEETAPLALEDQLRAYAQQMKAVSWVGHACLNDDALNIGADDRQTADRLLSDLATDLESRRTEDLLESRISLLIQDDFTSDRVLDIDGWQLSITECRLATLAALSQGILSARLPELPGVKVGKFVEVTDWGPKTTARGEPFNEQPDGHSGLWFKAIGAPASTVMLFNGEAVHTEVYDDLLTSGLRGEMMRRVLDQPGVYTVEFLDKSRQVRQLVGEFTVVDPGTIEPGEPVENCRVYRWGPEYSKAGAPFNEQPGGESAFWVKSNCAIPGSLLELNGQVLKTTVRQAEGLLTATVPAGHELDTGLHELTLRPGGGKDSLVVGSLRVEP